MKKQFKLGVIGFGATAESVLRGVVLSDLLRAKKVAAYCEEGNFSEEIDELGINVTDDCAFLVSNSEFVVLACYPHKFAETVKNFGGYVPEKVISLMPKVKKNAIKNAFGITPVKVARCITNLPCEIGSGVTGVDMTDFNKSTDDTDFITAVFDCLGNVLSVDESRMNAVTALNCDGTVYALMLVDSLVDAAVAQGLGKEEAKALVLQTLSGTCEMIARGEKTPSQLILEVSKYSGGAVQTVKTLEDGGFRKVIADAVEASVKYGKD